MHTSAHNETEAIKEAIALNTILAATQWPCDCGQPELAANAGEFYRRGGR